MGRLVMANIEINEDDMEMSISDIQRIDHVPSVVQNVIKNNIKGRRLNSSGLPSVQYLGPNRINVIGAFTYGEVSFLEIEGKWKNIVDGTSLVCVTAFRPDRTYEQLLEEREDYKKEIKEKYPNGLEVNK